MQLSRILKIFNRRRIFLFFIILSLVYIGGILALYFYGRKTRAGIPDFLTLYGVRERNRDTFVISLSNSYKGKVRTMRLDFYPKDFSIEDVEVSKGDRFEGVIFKKLDRKKEVVSLIITEFGQNKELPKGTVLAEVKLTVNRKSREKQIAGEYRVYYRINGDSPVGEFLVSVKESEEKEDIGISPQPTRYIPSYSYAKEICDYSVVTQDSFVAEGRPDKNFGGLSYIQVAEKGRLIGLLEFKNWKDRAQENYNLLGATLQMYIFGGSNGLRIGVYTVEKEWNERKVTWLSKPIIGEKIGEFEFKSTGWNMVDIRKAIELWVQKDLPRSLALVAESDNPGWDFINLYSKEGLGGKYKPKVRVCWSRKERKANIYISPTPMSSLFQTYPRCRVVRKRGGKSDVVVSFKSRQQNLSYIVYFFKKGKSVLKIPVYNKSNDVRVWIPKVENGWYRVRVEAYLKGVRKGKADFSCGVF